MTITNAEITKLPGVGRTGNKEPVIENKINKYIYVTPQSMINCIPPVHLLVHYYLVIFRSPLCDRQNEIAEPNDR